MLCEFGRNPFFDFHIDLEREGRLLCLRLTGEDGIKPFILAEFHVAAERTRLALEQVSLRGESDNAPADFVSDLTDDFDPLAHRVH